MEPTSITIGLYAREGAIPGLESARDVGIVLHRLDEETFVLGDDAGGSCLPDRPIPAALARRAFSGDPRALAQAGADIEAFFLRPNFRFASGPAARDGTG